MSRLWVRLALAFAAVTLVAVASIGLLARAEVGSGFRQFVAHTQAIGLDETSGPGADLVARLADHYRQAGSWAGVEAVLPSIHGGAGWMGGAARGQGGAMAGGSNGSRSASAYIVADAQGEIVYDGSGAAMEGQQLDGPARAGAVPIRLDGETVGYLLASPRGMGRLPAVAESFLTSLDQSLARGAAIGVALGIAAGLLVARSLSAPLGHLARAAVRVADGRLDERVPVEGAGEVTQVAMAFNAMVAHLEQSEARRRQMVSDVAHELRTPLAVIQGNLRAILDDVYPLAKAEVALIFDETCILTRLVDDLGELAQADAGQLALHPRVTALAPLVRTAVDAYGEAARAGGVALEAVVEDGLPSVHADPDRLRQVVHNLLSNALRHTPAGGSVRVEAVQEGSMVHVSVADTGVGIAAEDLPHVFDRFWRAERSRSRSAGGSGLGLAIARHLVEAGGGTIRAESGPGVGTRFTFTVPVSPER